MCLIKKPKAVAVTQSGDADTPVLRNPFLDGIDPIIRSRSTGLRSLRIDRGTPGVQAPATPSTSPLTIQPAQQAADPAAAAKLKVIRGLFGNKIGT